MPEKLSASEQSRINGAKSKGPTSAEGKAISSKNALKHGFAATINVVLRIEDEPAFAQHVEGFRASYEPRNYAEQSFVDHLASINWRQSRLVGLETALIDAQIGIQDEKLCAINPLAADDDYFHLVKAWQALARQPQKPASADQPRDPTLPPEGYDIGSIELLRRYQVSLDRQFRNTLLNLRQYRKDFYPGNVPGNANLAIDSPQPNEPSVAPPPAPQTNESDLSQTTAPPKRPPAIAEISRSTAKTHEATPEIPPTGRLTNLLPGPKLR